jgi:pimeloyl-ACP methyl ester carboxylesterase
VTDTSIKQTSAKEAKCGPDAMERHLRAPLADFYGSVPAAPKWFNRVIAQVPERTYVTVQSAEIETLVWGQLGQPGLLFMHGNAATADLWRFIAPFFSGSHRVVALSWSGMGGSDWRDQYSIETFHNEALTVAESLGLFTSNIKPIFAGHSAGGGPALLAGIENGKRLAGVLAIDSVVRPPNEIPPKVRSRPHRIYTALEEALARFRFAPYQPCVNLYIADMIARASLHEVEGGWTWRFDPALWRNFRLGVLWDRLDKLRCPVALVNAQYSELTHSQRIANMMARLPPDTANIVIPECYHHLMVDQPLAFVSVVRAIIAEWQGVSAVSQGDL